MKFIFIYLSGVLTFLSYNTMQAQPLSAITPNMEEELLPQMQELAQSESKYFLIYLTTEYCPVCLTMNEGTWTSKELNNYLDLNYLVQNVNAQLDFSGLELVEKYQVEYFPSILVFNSKGTMLKKLEGYQSADNLITILKQYKNKTMPF